MSRLPERDWTDIDMILSECLPDEEGDPNIAAMSTRRTERQPTDDHGDTSNNNNKGRFPDPVSNRVVPP